LADRGGTLPIRFLRSTDAGAFSEDSAVGDTNLARDCQRGSFRMEHAERAYLPSLPQGAVPALELRLLAHKRFGLCLRHADWIGDAHVVQPRTRPFEGRHASGPGTLHAY
jgi:hypothetical protein